MWLAHNVTNRIAIMMKHGIKKNCWPNCPAGQCYDSRTVADEATLQVKILTIGQVKLR
jgi:hypothetical protein